MRKMSLSRVGAGVAGPLSLLEMHVLHLFLKVLDAERQMCKKGFSSKLSSPEKANLAIDKAQEVRYTSSVLNRHGDRSSIGRALDCGSSGCGFKPHRSPPPS